MSCHSVQDRLSEFLDRLLADEEREKVAAHLASCPACSARFQSFETTRATLRRMPNLPVSAALAMKLRVLASHERQRRLSRASVSAWLRYCHDRASLQFDNLMRPMALPFAGGLLSALLLFSMLVPNLSFRHTVGDDLQLVTYTEPEGRLVESLPADGAPTWFWTGNSPEPTLESADAVDSGKDTVLELIIDETGRVADYSVSHGQLTAEMRSIILLSRFTPATLNGKNTWGKKLVRFPSGPRRTRRNVRS
ncbi:MAG TPA: zf-HC2 domain-containing protein [Bryobacteraceae bacterium]|nr:zf-HC2 domain-containing protein [Bryobacteraceae bacterium]